MELSLSGLRKKERKKKTIQAGLWGRSENGGHVTKVGGGLKSTRLVVVSSQFSKGHQCLR